jgi:hypothetical protein
MFGNLPNWTRPGGQQSWAHLGALPLKEAPYSFQYMSVFYTKTYLINLNLKEPNFLHKPLFPLI